LFGLRSLFCELRLAVAATAHKAAGAARHALAVALGGASGVTRIAIRGVGGPLVGAVVAAGHVAAGNVHGRVGVDRVLLGLGLGERRLLGLGLLCRELRLAVAATPHNAAGAARHALAAALAGAGFVFGTAFGLIGCCLVGFVFATVDVAAGGVGRSVGVNGVLRGLGLGDRLLFGLSCL